MIIYMRHIRAAKMCSRGARQWFDRYGIDWMDFLNNGIDEDILLATNCLMAITVVDVAHGR